MSAIVNINTTKINKQDVVNGRTMEDHINRHEEFMSLANKLMIMAKQTKKNATIRNKD